MKSGLKPLRSEIIFYIYGVNPIHNETNIEKRDNAVPLLNQSTKLKRQSRTTSAPLDNHNESNSHRMPIQSPMPRGNESLTDFAQGLYER